MTYLDLINRFWRCDEHYSFTCVETRLYFYLLKVANVLGWGEMFVHADDKTAANVGVDPRVMKNARNRLAQANLIEFERGGKGYGDRTKYRVVVIREEIGVQNMQPNSLPKTLPNSYPNSLPKTLPTLKKEVDVDKKENTEFSLPEIGISDEPPKIPPIPPPPEKPKPKPKPEPSPEGKQFAAEFRAMLPPDMDTTAADLQNWAITYDDLIRLDGRKPEEIHAVAKWARNDGFWQYNFLSATKLRAKDKSGTKYYDIFLQRMKSNDAHYANNGTTNGASNGKPPTRGTGTINDLIAIGKQWGFQSSVTTEPNIGKADSIFE